MPCSSEEKALASFFSYVYSFSFLFLVLCYFSSILLARFFHFVGTPLFPSDDYGYDQHSLFSDEEEEKEEGDAGGYFQEECRERDHLVTDNIGGGEALVFLPPNKNSWRNQSFSEDSLEFQEAPDVEEAEEEDGDRARNVEAVHDTPELASESENDYAEEIPSEHGIPLYDTNPKQSKQSSETNADFRKLDAVENGEILEEDYGKRKLLGEEKFFIFAPTQVETRKLKPEEKEDEEREIFGDSCTAGSTSKSSSEWRSSIKDSATEDPFSSSSRRSCPKWESYTVFQKYDEEMMFLDRISAQKLHETESLRSIEVRPRSVSERIVSKIANRSRKKTEHVRHNPYHELEAAYVAQICLAWEALNWNYKNFESKRASRGDFDPGCPAKLAQQFQQFQVLLQRYIENEPYEHGRRPEIYARMRLLAPKLLQVPEYQDSEDDQEGFGSRISSPSFLMIMEDGIRTFMNFLKADREKTCQLLISLFRKKKRGSVDPALLLLMKKVNKKKRMKLKDLRRSHKCLRRRRLTVEEEMEIVMARIDLEVVYRVLRMADLSEQQLHWCEEKMSRVRILEGKLHRDSSPLFFPAH